SSTLSLHDALPICPLRRQAGAEARVPALGLPGRAARGELRPAARDPARARGREGRARDAPQGHPGPHAAAQAEGLRRPDAPARRAAAAALPDQPGRPVGPAYRRPTTNQDARTPPVAETTNDTELEGDAPSTYTSESAAPVGQGQSLTAPGHGLGRRKEAVARVRLVPGSGQWKINGRTLEEYFPNKVHQ